MSGKITIGHGMNRVTDTLRARLFKGLGANLLGQLINLVVQAGSSAVVLACLGCRYLRGMAVAFFLCRLSSLTDMGGQLYVVNRLTQAHASRDMDLFRTLLRTGLSVFLVMPAIFLIGFVLFINLYHVESILGVVRTDHQESCFGVFK